VIQKASLEIMPREFIGLIGPNGGGKTTALKLMLGFLKPQEGTVKIAGSIGYVPQTTSYDPAFPISVYEVILSGCAGQLTFWGQYPKKAHEQASHLIKTFELEEQRGQPYGSLSGGQAQKTLIARALISDLSILLLDEPTANIDAKTEKQIFAFLKELKKEKTILIVTHNFDAIIQNVDRVICFQQEVTTLKPENVCEHFSIGMYHKPTVLSDE